MKKTYRYCLILVISISSCKTSNIPSGIYKFYNGTEVTTLKLDSPNTFKYYYTLGLMSIYSEGKSWVQKDSLFLKSNEEVTWINGRVIEAIDNSNEYTLIRVLDDYAKVKIQKHLVIINGTDTAYTDKEGEIKYHKPINTLFINYVDMYDFFYSTKNINSNTLNIYLVPMSNSNKYFAIKSYLIKGRQLIHNKEIFVKKR